MESKAVFGGGQGKAGEGDNKLNIDSIIARLLEGEKDKNVQSLHPHLVLILSSCWCHSAFQHCLNEIIF